MILTFFQKATAKNALSETARINSSRVDFSAQLFQIQMHLPAMMVHVRQ